MLAAAAIGITLTVLPLGDSITDGVPTEDGYRGHLAAGLRAAGIGVKYVGSRRSGAGPHEGWSGYTTGELLPLLRSALAKHRPDVVLLHIGTNDLGMGVPLAEAATNVDRMLGLVADRGRSDGGKPIRVFVAQIIGRNLGPERDDAIYGYNARLADVVAARRKAGQPVELVDMHAAIDPTRDLADALHPSDGGYQKIARTWLKAILAAGYGPGAKPAKAPPAK